MYVLSENYKNFVKDNSCHNEVIQDIEAALIDKRTTSGDLKELISKCDYFRGVRGEVLDYLISYANFILQDNFISEKELYDFSVLKRIFKIKPGEFIKSKEFQVLEILKQQFMRMYADNYIDQKEAITNVNLQFMFDLSYDEYEKLKEDDVIAALINGADPKDLDISSLPNGFKL